MSNTIKVVARFRPQNKIELASGGEPIVDFNSEDTCTIQSKEAAGAFTFDRVFDMASRQADVFDYSIRSTVDDILNGYNGTVFAYGQTGAGKSYTMMGSDIDDEAGRGVIPRIVQQVFANIMASPSNIEYTVRVSYMEIYMERIRDLLMPQNDNLPVHEEKNRGVYVKGLLEVYVASEDEVYEVLRRGGTARAVSATNMNAESSRSHSIFVVTVSQKNVETGSQKSGQLFLVDLAGSEKVGKTGASGQTLEEAKKINKSLSALGMVINSLTDGKSSHIPYRDSKLTRILQESLGGNSRTTLIINCSPSSYNDAETLSTLRFGMRAKSIKNKAKINAELSPAELKAMLKKAQGQATTFENYIAALESEVSMWRGGETVPKERWIPALDNGTSTSKRPPSAPRAGTPSRLDATKSSEAPSRPDSRMDLDRAGTPSIPLEKDEKDEFLKRENELQDQIAEKESQLAKVVDQLTTAKDELQYYKDRDSKTNKDNERMTSELNEMKMQVEKIQFESKEAQISMDALKEANAELTAELDDVKQQLLDAKMNAKETSAAMDEKKRKKAEAMAQMMAGFDLGGEVFSDNERSIRRIIEQLDQLHEMSSAGEAIAPDAIQELREKLVETQGIVRQAELSLTERNDEDDAHNKRREALEARFADLQSSYEQLLEQNLSESDKEELKSKLTDAYAARQEGTVELVDDLKKDLARRAEDNTKLKTEIESLQQRIKSGAIANGVANGINGKTVQQQIAEFDNMKKSLMRDLQNRCERVVELEISLDETREQYNNVLRTSNNRAQQKKMMFLERNLEQLTVVQRQLVEQNSSLKKEVAIAERKLIARNERIQSLESLLQDSQEKLTAANHRFEAQLTAVKERLEAAKAGSTRGLGSPSGPGASFAFGGGVGSRIAKPLRGGGAVQDGPVLPVIGNLQKQDGDSEGNKAKRTSWFFNNGR
ncbi:kinesin-like protein [Parastagonospora nodorum]|uniref:Kinesin-like protein n=1 Tax=Phaeosphaeria nodorum (strain SN15 / ATCC MYA-4574 / FGSC 10173) TaxID=321614 RepID=A0A7U2F6E5_PHANO|nr:kinesin-like protein [Parastagonospora nodorum]QRC99217.1 kinesin-like protein [Parastagonospora nodorum SN15]KAH3934507.1 kinesin-like protein [Parastagonospora nodorum]KAH3943046.1 kinesin-like protein [Parastagonospora nodorum]KAH3959250.1 kinesin-like protein [Parastagonospora nodorum]